MSKHPDNHTTAETLLNQGISLLRQGEHLRALYFVEKAHALMDTPLSRSYFGLLKTTERGLFKEGRTMCESALNQDPSNPLMHLNLAKVLYHMGQKAEAMDMVTKSRELGTPEETVEWLRLVGLRRDPAFSFLRREHPINRYIGLLLSRLGMK